MNDQAPMTSEAGPAAGPELGAWMQLHSGQAFWFAEPGRTKLRKTDIAVPLSQLCRFGGHCREFYSVAQHSLVVMHLVGISSGRDPLLMLAGLLHDAHEAFLGDRIQPLKQFLDGPEQTKYRELAYAIDNWISRSLGVWLPFADEQIQAADLVALATEKRDLLGESPEPWCALPPPSPMQLQALDVRTSRDLFIASWGFLQRDIFERVKYSKVFVPFLKN